MGVTTALRQEIRSRFFPFMQQRGFVLDQQDAPSFWRFRRITATEAHIVEIQWEKYGRRRFVVNFGRCPKDGLSLRGEHIPVEKISAGWLDGGGRLRPGSSRTTAGWFRQDKPLLNRLFSSEKLVPASQVVSQLMMLFPEIEEYWERGAIGKHVTIHPLRV